MFIESPERPAKESGGLSRVATIPRRSAFPWNSDKEIVRVTFRGRFGLNMNKKEVLSSISFGGRTAEDEADNLRRIFVETDQWQKVNTGEVGEAYLDAYISAAGISEEKKGPLFRSVDKNRRLTLTSMTRTDVLRMIKRRALAAGLP